MQKDTSAFRTLLIRWTLPGHKIAFRIAHTAIITAAFLRLLNDDILAALRTAYADFLEVRLGISAFRESRTCQELTVRTILDDHHTTALIALDI